MHQPKSGKIIVGISDILLAENGADAPKELQGKLTNEGLCEYKGGGWIIIEKKKTGPEIFNVDYPCSVSQYREDVDKPNFNLKIIRI